MDECFVLVFTRPVGRRGGEKEEGKGEGGVEEGVYAVVTLQAPA